MQCRNLSVATALGLFSLASPLFAQGLWTSAFDHPGGSGPNFNALHMAVIPGIPHPGEIIVWNLNSTHSGTGSWTQSFAFGAPESATFTTRSISIPSEFGDLFCAGHTWMPDGRLFVAGGTTKHPGNFPNGQKNVAGVPICSATSSGGNYCGSRFAGIWDPAGRNTSPNYGWTFLCDPSIGKAMNAARWYPTVTLLADDKIMVAGGVEDNSHDCNPNSNTPSGFRDPAICTYEVFDITANDWERDANGDPQLYPDPSHPSATWNGNAPGWSSWCFSEFGEYPRLSLVSTGHVFLSAQWQVANRVLHVSGNTSQDWLPPAGSSGLDSLQNRQYCSAVILPNVGRTAGNYDHILKLGGGWMNPSQVAFKSCQVIDATAASPTWSSTAIPDMANLRHMPNAVLLPDGAVLVIGGSSTYYWNTATPVLAPEVYRASAGTWTTQSSQSSGRMYHSTAALLPSGNVVSAGGDSRSCDYEVFIPDNLYPAHQRLQFSAMSSLSLTWNTAYNINIATPSGGHSVSSVVLMRPCSVTHHSDFDQRYVELELIAVGGSPYKIRVRTPPAPNPNGTVDNVIAPKGWYMMFMIDNTGMPSIGRWIHLS